MYLLAEPALSLTDLPICTVSDAGLAIELVLEHRNLPAIGILARARSPSIGVRQVLGDHAHALALRAHARSGDHHRFHRSMALPLPLPRDRRRCATSRPSSVEAGRFRVVPFASRPAFIICSSTTTALPSGEDFASPAWRSRRNDPPADELRRADAARSVVDESAARRFGKHRREIACLRSCGTKPGVDAFAMLRESIALAAFSHAIFVLQRCSKKRNVVEIHFSSCRAGQRSPLIRRQVLPGTLKVDFKIARNI